MLQGGEDGRCRSVSIVQQFAGKANSHASYYQTDCSGGQATRNVGGGIMVACGVALDVQLLVTRRR